MEPQHRTDAHISAVTATVFPDKSSSVWSTGDSAGSVIWLIGTGPLPGKTKPNPIRR